MVHQVLTIEQLIDQDKVVLDCFFVQFTKVRARNGNEAVQELENESCIGVASTVDAVMISNKQQHNFRLPVELTL
jgi:hypothetical protein